VGEKQCLNGKLSQELSYL